MSEPVTLFCIESHQYGSRMFVPGDVVTLTAPSVAREFVATGLWSYDPPDDSQATPDPEVQTTPEVESQLPPAKPRGRGKKHA